MIYTSSNEPKWSTTEHSHLLGRQNLVLPYLSHLNKWRTSMISTPERSTLVPIQLEQWKDVFYPWNITIRHWQLQWSCPGKSPKWVQRHPYLYRISHQFRQQRRRPNQWTNLPISDQPIYGSSSAIHCPSSPWNSQYQHVNHHSHYDPNTIQYPCWRSRPSRRRTSRRRRRRQWARRRQQHPTSPTGGKAHGCTTNDFWRRLLKSWEFHQRVLHISPS